MARIIAVLRCLRLGQTHWQESWQKRMSLALEELLVIMDGTGKQQAVVMTDVKCCIAARIASLFGSCWAAVADRYGALVAAG